MKVGLVYNAGARGLSLDAQLLIPLIEAAGHEVELIQYDEPCEKKYGLLIFLEVTPRNLIKLSATPPWLIVNPEFLKQDGIKLVQRHFGKILCKTHEAHRICSALFGERAHYTGFISEDKYDASFERKQKFLHVAGQSQVKGTAAIIDSFRWARDGQRLNVELTVVADWLSNENMPEGVTVLNKISDAELKRLQNECLFHLQPSQTEGWSHVIHESLSVGATILTVDFPPMSEIQSAYMIKPVSESKFHLARMCEVSALDIYDAVNDLLAIGNIFRPREEFLKGNADFKAAFTAHLSDVTPQIPSRIAHTPGSALRVAFLGNFLPEDSTENLVRWALEEGLGHEVEILQENTVKLEELEDAMQWNDVFLWVRTPNFLKVPDNKMCELLVDARIPTLSLHLDKFWGIPEREALIGIHPFFKTKYVFTADGSRQDEFRARGVNHIYMKPAASEVFAHRGRPREHFRCDVGFVGARGYHSQHQFRGKLIDSLEQTYGDRFKLIDSVRGHELNDFYASCKVSVADCFGGGKIPHYWSDRMVETPMRHGFLLSPKIEGMTIPLATFEPENLTDLHEKIEYWLSHENERRAVRFDCADHVRRYDTWTERLRMILSTVGFENKPLW